MSEHAVKVYDLAHCRAGDKGNTSNISVIAYEDRFYPFLRKHLLVLSWLGLTAFVLVFAFWPSTRPSKYFSDRTLVATMPRENLFVSNNGSLLMRWFWKIYFEIRPPKSRSGTWSFNACATQRCSIHGLLIQCHDVSGIQFFIDRNVAAGSVEFGSTNVLNGPQWMSAFTNALQSGVVEWWDPKKGGFRHDNPVFVSVGPRALLILPKERVTSYQR